MHALAVGETRAGARCERPTGAPLERYISLSSVALVSAVRVVYTPALLTRTYRSSPSTPSPSTMPTKGRESPSPISPHLGFLSECSSRFVFDSLGSTAGAKVSPPNSARAQSAPVRSWISPCRTGALTARFFLQGKAAQTQAKEAPAARTSGGAARTTPAAANGAPAPPVTRASKK